jgi:hypothetical protein
LAEAIPGYEYLEGKNENMKKQGKTENFIRQGLKDLKRITELYAKKAEEYEKKKRKVKVDPRGYCNDKGHPSEHPPAPKADDNKVGKKES